MIDAREGNRAATDALLSGGSLRSAATILGVDRKGLRNLRDLGACGRSVAERINDAVGLFVILPTPGAFSSFSSKPGPGKIRFSSDAEVKSWLLAHPLDVEHDNLRRFLNMILRSKGKFK